MANISSLDALRKSEEEAQSGQQGNEYYSGGASAQGGGSGLNVMDPTGRDAGNAGFMNGILNRARSEAASAPSDGPIVNVVFYANGFTLDDGPLRELGTPENDTFLQHILQGICPPELVKDGKAASVSLVDKRGETYKAPSFIAFSGAGRSAGETSDSSGSVLTPQANAVAPEVDESQPKVRIQLVFENRKRMVVSLNASHTLRDLAAVVDASGNVSGPYQMLMSTRGPPKPATDFASTLEAASLNGSAVTIKSV
mmetsp:Transcript_14414/g.25814  ORF Transcript_14414/g.25814 Transcript_14414/m.25814 type:complete len:255 (-) Transcript_14414:330-1094(-)